jgi:hypothetical protein
MQTLEVPRTALSNDGNVTPLVDNDSSVRYSF